MKTQLRIAFAQINWDLFCKRGALLASFDRNQIVLGMGESLAEGEVRFFQQDFFNEHRTEYIPEIICETTLEELKVLESTKQEYVVDGDEDDVYLRDLKKALDSFDEEFKKVVLISRERYGKTGISLKRLIGSLIAGDLGYNYGLWNEDEGILGSTPEILLSKRGNEYKSMALASTRPYELRDELLNDKKELYEHQLVIQDIEDKLLGQRNLTIGETGIEKFGALAHLRTDVSFESNESIDKLIKDLSPTAALGGYPKNMARSFIKESEYCLAHPGRKFGGVVGLAKGTDVFALVAIRNIQWNKEHYWIECGGGVVADSTVENELAEVRRKRKVIRDLFFKTTN